ncbi:MAG: signal peptidase I [Anaerolineales bacterium]|jgi:signal peptidase I
MNNDIPDLTISLEEEEKPNRFRAFLLESLETIVLAVVLFVIINALTARIRVDGSSMVPSLVHNNYVLVNRLAYQLGDIQRGDVVVFEFPQNREEDYIKRVIALSGETVEIANGVVYIDGQPLAEPYIQAPMLQDYPPVTVPQGMVYVMGDNRNDSSDSRRWGALAVDEIIGKAIFVYWPFSDFGVVTHYDFSIP